MRRRRTITRKPAKTQHGSTTKPKRSNAPTAAGGRGSSVADLLKQLDLRTRKLAETQSKLDQQSRVLSEALDQQKATSEVLRVISNSPIDLQSALGAIAESAARLLDVAGAEITRLEGDGLRLIEAMGATLAIRGMIGGALVNLDGSGTTEANGDTTGDACDSGSSIPSSQPIGGLVSIGAISATLLPRKSKRCFSGSPLNGLPIWSFGRV